jgi:hypothetical protein
VTGSGRVAIIAGAGVVVLAAVAAAVFFSLPERGPASSASPAGGARTPAAAAPSPTPSATPSPRPKTAAAPKAAISSASPTLEPPAAEPTTGTLHITSDVPETSVFIDRKYLGTAPVTAGDLTPGAHHLNMSATGFDGVSEDITVEAGSHDLPIKFKEIKLDAKAAVVHKHAFGSCAGTLHATPQGLQYDTTNADDAFSVPLIEIERFEVDYLNKNLRVKVRRGKTYNFSDPDGNADRLFVFQRDVEKVRQRLLAARGQ